MPFFYFYTLIRGFPLHLVLFVTDRCNSQCKMCFNWRNQKESDIRKELKLPEIRKISEQMPNFPWLLIGGGEPSLRNDLAEICTIFYKNNKVKNISIPFNGLLPSKIKQLTKKILINCPKAKVIIFLALDGIGGNHDEIRGVRGNFVKFLESYKGLNLLRKKYPNLFIAVNITCSYYNQNKLLEICDFVENKLKVDHINLNFIRGETYEPIAKDINPAYYEECTYHLNQQGGKRKFKYHGNLIARLARAKDSLQTKIILKAVKEKKPTISCLAGKSIGVISSRGEVYPCEMLNKSMGSLRDYDYNFARIWKSKKAKQIRKYIRDTKCFCTYECAITSSILFNPRAYPLWIKELLKLK